jgi:hypothetical protein
MNCRTNPNYLTVEENKAHDAVHPKTRYSIALAFEDVRHLGLIEEVVADLNQCSPDVQSAEVNVSFSEGAWTSDFRWKAHVKLSLKTRRCWLMPTLNQLISAKSSVTDALVTCSVEEDTGTLVFDFTRET